MANTFLAAGGLSVADSLCEPDYFDVAQRIKSAAENNDCQIILPVDAVVAENFAAHSPSVIVDVTAVPKTGMILDLGPKSIDKISVVFAQAATLVWNGPLGAFELPPFDTATTAAAQLAAMLTVDNGLISVAGVGILLPLSITRMFETVLARFRQPVAHFWNGWRGVNFPVSLPSNKNSVI